MSKGEGLKVERRQRDNRQRDDRQRDNRFKKIRGNSSNSWQRNFCVFCEKPLRTLRLKKDNWILDKEMKDLKN